MPIELVKIGPEHVETVRGLVKHESLSTEFAILLGPDALESWLADPFMDRELSRIAFLDGEPAGFGFTLVLPAWTGKFGAFRCGVIDAHRRKGLGTAMLHASLAGVRQRHPDARELVISAWMPNDAAVRFAEKHELTHERWFWLMEQAPEQSHEPEWPEGIETHVFDGSEKMLADWCDAYNRSFRHHYHGVISTVDDCRAIAARPDAHPDGTLLAYRNGLVVGFCRNELREAAGEVGALGVVEEARGIGLGRALLRWGSQWLRAAGTPKVTLMVDGENESALGLYRSEGFRVTKEREVWGMQVPR